MNQDQGLLREASDWEVLETFLPDGWEAQAKKLGALRRCRKFVDAKALLRTLMIHLAEGCSLRETAVRAKHGNLAAVSDVALLKRLKISGEWMRWMATQMMENWVSKPSMDIFGDKFRIRMVDGSSISEPGSKGTDWRIHYSIHFPSLQCDEVHLSSVKVGESFLNFSVNPGDLFLADRGYAKRNGIAHVVNHEGAVLVRLHSTSLALEDAQGFRFALLEHLNGLRINQIGDWDVQLIYENQVIQGRVCALKKSKLAIERAHKKIRRNASRKGHQTKPETFEVAKYFCIFTTLEKNFPPSSILEMYRGRWQIELAFKRLKSIMGLGHLKKTDLNAAKSWLHGKLFVAFLVEALIAAGERFSPWGYPLGPSVKERSVALEGNRVDASSDTHSR